MAKIRIKRNTTENQVHGDNTKLLPGELALGGANIWFGPKMAGGESDDTTVQARKLATLGTDSKIQQSHMPIAASSVVGGIKSSDSLSIDTNGVPSVSKLTTPVKLAIASTVNSDGVNFSGASNVLNIPLAARLSYDVLAEGAGASSTQRKVLGTGQSTTSGNLALQTLTPTDVGAIPSVFACTSATAIGTSVKLVSSERTPVVGDIFAITFTYGNTANDVTLNINSSGGKNIRLASTAALNGTNNSGAINIKAGGTILVYYSGTEYLLFGSQLSTDVAPLSHVGATGDAHGNATTSTTGFVKVPEVGGIKVASGSISVNVGAGLEINNNLVRVNASNINTGTLSNDRLNKASTTQTGIMKVGANLTVDGEGVVSGQVQEASSNYVQIAAGNWSSTSGNDTQYGKYKFSYVFGSGINYQHINYAAEVIKTIGPEKYIQIPCVIIKNKQGGSVDVYVDESGIEGFLILTSGGANDSQQGGHQILDSNGAVLSNKVKMQFTNGLNAINNDVDGKTVVSLGNHASSGTDYGVASASNYGHVKIGTNISVSSGTISIANASTSAKGVVELENNLTSNDSAKALTAAQGKILKDAMDGKELGRSFTNISTMVSAINNTGSDYFPQNKYWVGFNLFILTQNVPDFWISSRESTPGAYSWTSDAAFISAVDGAKATGGLHVGYYKIGRSDLAKVDLTDYLPIAGGTLTGDLTMAAGKKITSTTGGFAGPLTGEVTGNASTATQLKTARSLKVALGSSAAVTFNGSAAQDAIPVTGTLSVANGGTGLTNIESGQLMVGQGTNAVTTRAITNNASATKIVAGTNIPTMNTLYHGTPTINNSKEYDSSTAIYAPTTGGTTDKQVLVSDGLTSTPIWINQSALTSLALANGGTRGSVIGHSRTVNITGVASNTKTTSTYIDGIIDIELDCGTWV